MICREIKVFLSTSVMTIVVLIILFDLQLHASGTEKPNSLLHNITKGVVIHESQTASMLDLTQLSLFNKENITSIELSLPRSFDKDNHSKSDHEPVQLPVDEGVLILIGLSLLYLFIKVSKW